MNTNTARYATFTTSQKIAVNVLGGIFILVALLTGLAVGNSTAPAPARADVVECAIICGGSGSGGNVPANLPMTGSGGSGGNVPTTAP